MVWLLCHHSKQHTHKQFPFSYDRFCSMSCFLPVGLTFFTLGLFYCACFALYSIRLFQDGGRGGSVLEKYATANAPTKEIRKLLLKHNNIGSYRRSQVLFLACQRLQVSSCQITRISLDSQIFREVQSHRLDLCSRYRLSSSIHSPRN